MDLDDISQLEGQEDTEDSNDGKAVCISSNVNSSIAENFVQQRRTQLLKAAEERERRVIRENHLRRETFKIVESLLEGRTDEEYLIKCASLLSQSDFDDVHEERSLASFCGYPLCDHHLEKAEVQKKKQLFKIDSKNKAIYRMEEYQRFCSVGCLRASCYLREQMSTEPLWMRYTDEGGYDELYQKGFDTFKLYHHQLPHEKTQEENIENEKCNQSIEPSSQKIEQVKHDVSLKESVSFPYIKQEHLEQLRKSINGLTIKERNINPVEETDESCELTGNLERVKLKEEKNQVSGKISTEKMGTDVGEGKKLLLTVTETQPQKQPTTSSDQEEGKLATKIWCEIKKDEEVLMARNQVYERLKEWMTFDSYIFIFGSSIIDELIQLQRLKINEDEEGKNEEEEIFRKKKLMEVKINNICQKLDDEEILDQLILETDQIEVGRAKIESEVKRKHPDDDGTKSKQRKSKDGIPKKVTFDPLVTVSSPDPDGIPNHTTILPPTSLKSQNRLRKQLFSRQLERTLSIQKISPEIVSHICPLTRELIDTFKFTPQNVVVSNHDWPELLLCLFKLIDVRFESKCENLDSSRIAIMKEKSVINLYQKTFPTDSLSSEFEAKISTLLNSYVHFSQGK